MDKIETFYRSSCGRIVQRVPGHDEFGDPQVTEHYMPIEAARAMLDELAAALSELEGSKPKELTDDAPFTAFESEHYKGSFGVRGPHYSVAGLVNMSAAEALADKMNWAFRLGRDHGHLSPQPKEPPRYVMSRDYDALYELLCNGGEALGTCLDVDEGECVGTLITDAEIVDGEDHFIAECTRLNLEWIAVEPPKEQGAEPVAWMTEDGKEFVENWVREEWDKDNGPTAQFFIPRYPTPLYRHPQPLPAPTSREKAMEEAIDKLLPLAQRIQAACEDGDVLNYDNEYDQRDAIEYEKVIAEAIAAKSTK